jgi:hypothetical protein
MTMTKKPSTANTAKTTTRVARLPLSLALRWSLATSAVFAVLVGALLTLRMAAGADPALGPKVAAERSAAPAPVVSVPVSPPAPAPMQTSAS